MIGLIPVQNSDVLAACAGFFEQLLETGMVEALYVPLETENGAIVPALVTDPARWSALIRWRRPCRSTAPARSPR